MSAPGSTGRRKQQHHVHRRERVRKNDDASVARWRSDRGCRSRRWRGRWHAVATIANRWRVRSAWWSADAWREYFKLTTADGLLCTVYHDLQSDSWFWARLYD